MANPDYATLLPQIAAETDATKKQALIDECYQFNQELTLEEKSLFSYFTPDNDNELIDYVTDNPGLTNGNEYVSYVGDYYNQYGQSTNNTGNIFGGPFYIYGTGASGFGTGSTGFFHPLYTSTEQIQGSYHVHTFVEYPGYSFYMPDTSMNHAVETRPTDIFEYTDTTFTATPTVTVEYTAPAQQQEQDDSGDSGGGDSGGGDSGDSEGGDSEPTTTTQTAAVALPSTDGTTNNYGGITGLTITRATTTSSVATTGSYYSPQNTSKSFGNSSSSSGRAGARGREDNGTITINPSGASSNYGTGGTIPTSGVNGTGSGPWTTTTTSTSDVGYFYYQNTSSTSYSFTNNTGYSATIEGTTLANGAGPTAITITGDVDVTYTTGS